MIETIDIDHNHPVEFIRALSEKVPLDTKFLFEVYKRTNKNYASLDIGKIIADISAEEFLDSWDEVKGYLAGLIKMTEANFGSDYEMGIVSRVQGNGHLIYLPCIDFINDPPRYQVKKLIHDLAQLIGPSTLWLYDSGRSLHGYIDTLISPIKNKQYQELLKWYVDIVDVKWVDHSSNKGHSLLRWSAISSHHNTMPKFIEQLRF